MSAKRYEWHEIGDERGYTRGPFVLADNYDKVYARLLDRLDRVKRLEECLGWLLIIDAPHDAATWAETKAKAVALVGEKGV